MQQRELCRQPNLSEDELIEVIPIDWMEGSGRQSSPSDERRSFLKILAFRDSKKEEE